MLRVVQISVTLVCSQAATIVMGDHNTIETSAPSKASAATTVASETPALATSSVMNDEVAPMSTLLDPKLTYFKGVPDFGYPRCFSDKKDYKYDFVDDRDYYFVMKTDSGAVYPYDTYTEEDCEHNGNFAIPPVAYTTGHTAAIDVLTFKKASSGAQFPLPDVLDGMFIVANRGSWNRVDPVGRMLNIYSIVPTDLNKHQFNTTGHSMLTPPWHGGRENALLDLRVSHLAQSDHGELFFTANTLVYEDGVVENDAEDPVTGGIYAIAYSTNSSKPANTLQSWKQNELTSQGDFPKASISGTSHLVWVANMPCARGIASAGAGISDVDIKAYISDTASPSQRQGFFVATSTVICFPAEDAKAHGYDVYYVEVEGYEKKFEVKVASNMYIPYGVEYDSASDKLFVATSHVYDDALYDFYVHTPKDHPSVSTNNGLYVLENAKAKIASALLFDDKLKKDTHLPDADKYDLSSALLPHFKRKMDFPVQHFKNEAMANSHFWKSLQITPDKKFLLAGFGANCNWNRFCSAGILAISLDDYSTYVYAQGLRNSLGYAFSHDGSYVCLGENNSDDAEGVTTSTNAEIRTLMKEDTPMGEINCMKTPTAAQVVKHRGEDWESNPIYSIVEYASTGTLRNYAFGGHWDKDLKHHLKTGGFDTPLQSGSERAYVSMK